MAGLKTSHHHDIQSAQGYHSDLGIDQHDNIIESYETPFEDLLGEEVNSTVVRSRRPSTRKFRTTSSVQPLYKRPHRSVSAVILLLPLPMSKFALPAEGLIETRSAHLNTPSVEDGKPNANTRPSRTCLPDCLASLFAKCIEFFKQHLLSGDATHEDMRAREQERLAMVCMLEI